MPCVACREVVDAFTVYTTVHVTDDYLWWASAHCARTSATANSDLARPHDLAQPKPAHRIVLQLPRAKQLVRRPSHRYSPR